MPKFAGNFPEIRRAELRLVSLSMKDYDARIYAGGNLTPQPSRPDYRKCHSQPIDIGGILDKFKTPLSVPY